MPYLIRDRQNWRRPMVQAPDMPTLMPCMPGARFDTFRTTEQANRAIRAAMAYERAMTREDRHWKDYEIQSVGDYEAETAIRQRHTTRHEDDDAPRDGGWMQ